MLIRNNSAAACSLGSAVEAEDGNEAGVDDEAGVCAGCGGAAEAVGTAESDTKFAREPGLEGSKASQDCDCCCGSSSGWALGREA